MECITVHWPVGDRDGEIVTVQHTQTRLRRGLEIGEVVIVCHEVAFATATVLEIGFEPADTVYTLMLGESITETLAGQMLVDDFTRIGYGVTPAEVLDLLAELARRRREE